MAQGAEIVATAIAASFGRFLLPSKIRLRLFWRCFGAAVAVATFALLGLVLSCAFGLNVSAQTLGSEAVATCVLRRFPKKCGRFMDGEARC